MTMPIPNEKKYEKKETEQQQRLQSHVDSIAKDLSEGMTYEEAGLEHIAKDSGFDKEDQLSGFDWLDDVLDINYIVNSDKTFKTAKVLVAFGGPDIWVCFDDMKVKGYWWGYYAEAPFTDAMDIEASLEECYNC